eukprot:65913-Amphidinium_carterae.1
MAFVRDAKNGNKSASEKVAVARGKKERKQAYGTFKDVTFIINFGRVLLTTARAILYTKL